MADNKIVQEEVNTKPAKKRKPIVSVLIGLLNAFLIINLSILTELTLAVLFVSEISKDIDYEQLFVIDFIDINEFIQSVAPLIICLVLLVIFIALTFVANIKKIRTAFLSIGISFAICSVINTALGMLSHTLISVLPYSFREMITNKGSAFEDLMVFSAFGLLIIATVFISVFLVINYVRKDKTRSFKRNLIGMIAGLVCVSIVFAAVGVLVLIPKNENTETSKFDLYDQIDRLTSENEDVDFDEESGMLYINCEIIVIVETEASESDIEDLADAQKVRLDKTMADVGIYKFTYSDPLEYDDLLNKAAKIKRNEYVKDAYINVVTLCETGDEGAEATSVYPDDGWEGDNWNVSVPRGTNWGIEAIDAPDAWFYLDEMQTVRVGLIDCVPNTEHPDLANMFKDATFTCIDSETGVKEINAYNIPPQENHGSHVSGIMDAEWDNGVGVSGVMGGKGDLYFSGVYYDGGYGLLPFTGYDFLLALKTLIDQDVQVINISLGGSDLTVFAASRGNQNAIDYLTYQAEFFDNGLSRIISVREAQGKPDFVICVAAGNTNNNVFYKDDNEPYGYRCNQTPLDVLTGNLPDSGNALALYSNFIQMAQSEAVTDRVIVVGALEIDKANSTRFSTRYSVTDYSNVGSRVDIVAPGSDIYSCYDIGYDYMSGTSMASPHVAGVAGLVFACNPDLTGPQVKAILLASTTGRYYYYEGYSGMVNAKMAVVNAIQTKDKPVERVIRSAGAGGLDLCFVVDTTGSMGDDIDNAKDNMTEILSHLSEKTTDYRVAIIDYRDFSSRTYDSADYPYRVQLDFTSDNSTIQSAINRLSLGYGGDEEETVYSGLMAAANLEWRPDAKKVIIILGDAPPLDPEPETGYTYDDVVSALLSSDIGIDYGRSDARVTDSMDYSVINVYSIGTSASYDAEEFFEDISEVTGGSYSSVANASGVSDAIIDSIDQIEIIPTATAKADFGDSLAGQTIDIYQGGAYRFSVVPDESGYFEIENIEPDMYHWECPEMLTGGSMEIETNEKFASIRTKQEYWFNPAISMWKDNKTKIVPLSELAALLILFVPLFLAMAFVSLANKMHEKRLAAPKTVKKTVANKPNSEITNSGSELAKSNTVSKIKLEPKAQGIICPSCGKTLEPNDKFCGYCGSQLGDKK